MASAAEWRARAQRGTSGDMVWDLIADLERLEAEKRALETAQSERRPRRIQRKRTLGWRMPPWAVYVGRGKDPGPFGHNPYKVGVDGTRAECVALFIKKYEHNTAFRARVRQELAGKDLACWCPLDQPCHANVLLRWANEAP
jgi:hypothetical protein